MQLSGIPWKLEKLLGIYHFTGLPVLQMVYDLIGERWSSILKIQKLYVDASTSTESLKWTYLIL